MSLTLERPQRLEDLEDAFASEDSFMSSFPLHHYCAGEDSRSDAASTASTATTARSSLESTKQVTLPAMDSMHNISARLSKIPSSGSSFRTCRPPCIETSQVVANSTAPATNESSVILPPPTPKHSAQQHTQYIFPSSPRSVVDSEREPSRHFF